MDEQPPYDDHQQHAIQQKDAVAKIYAKDLDPEYQRKSLAQVVAAFEGNGITADQIGIEKFEGQYLEFIALTDIALTHNLVTKRQAGKATGGQKVQNVAAFEQETLKEIKKISRSRDVIKRIRDEVLKRKDKGLYTRNEKIKLAFLHKDFVAYEECRACGAKGKINCVQCHGKGEEPCPKCNTRGVDMCPVCGGRQYVQGPNNQRQQCQRCSGSGKIGCMQCHEGKFIKCRKCAASGSMQCNQCQGHAWNSVLCKAEIDANLTFDYERTGIPTNLLERLDHWQARIQNHAEINILERAQVQEKEHDDIAVAYGIKIPIAQILFKIKGRDVPALMFGTQARLYDMPPVLRAAVKKGIAALKNAAMGEGDAEKHLKTAGQFRILRRIIVNTSRMGPKKAYLAGIKENSIGIEEDAIKKIALMAQKATFNLNKKPRQIGYAITVLLSLGFAAAYWFVLKNIIETAVPLEMPAILGIHILIMCVAISGFYMAGNAYAKHKLKTTLETLFKR